MLYTPEQHFVICQRAFELKTSEYNPDYPDAIQEVKDEMMAIPIDFDHIGVFRLDIPKQVELCYYAKSVAPDNYIFANHLELLKALNTH